MLTIYENRSGALERQKGKPRMTETAVWVDLLNPTPEEEKQIERALKLDVPTREEQQEIEVSSRLYQEGRRVFHDGDLDVSARGRGAEDDARHLHSRRPAPRSRCVMPSRAPSPSTWRAATAPRRISKPARRS